MKVFQLNIWGGALINNILDVIDREDPDIICMQEVFSTQKGETYLFLDNLEYFLKRFPDYFFFYSPAWDNQTEGVKIKYGNVIFTKFPILKKETRFTAGAYKENLRSSYDDTNIRNFQHVVVDGPNGQVNVLNYHGYWVPEHKNGNDETMRQMKMISDYISDLSGSIILAGDFNLSPDSQSLDGLNGLLNNLCITHNIKNTRNQFAKRDSEVCDYIFVDHQTRVKDFRVLDDLISDHAALVLEI